MKLDTKERTVQTGGVSETTSFKVEMNAMMFHSVIDGIYADKISSPFRELCTNARDGHAANGNLNEAFDVFLPSLINPIFKVRDYGIGLSHEDIMGLYSTMFASSKRDSNDAVGMIGLGSKSPFAYTSAFTVTSFFEGMARVYSAFIGETGVPQISLMYETESAERGGIEVQFPVKQEDIKKFRDAAPRVLFGFSPFPNILNETFTRTLPEVLYSGDNWTMYSEKGLPFTSLMARQGCVLYPIDPKPLGVTLAVNKGYNAPKSIYEWPIVIDFPIGDLDVSTSRESLGYTPKTVENLKLTIQQVLSEMTRIVDTEIRQAPTFIEACAIAAEARNAKDNIARRDLFRTLFTSLRWQDKPLMERVSVSCYNQTAPFHWVDPEYTPDTYWGRFHPTLSFRPRKLMSFHKNMDTMRKVRVFVEFEELKNGPARMRKVLQDTPAAQKSDILWVRPVDRAALDKLIESLGWPQWVDLASIEPIFAPKAENSKSSLTRLRYHTTTNRYSSVETHYEYLIPTPDLYYIKQESGNFFLGAPNDPPMLATAMQEWLRQAVVTNLLPPNMKVYFLNTQNIKILETVKMKPIGDLIFENIKKLDFTTIIGQSDATARNQRTQSAKVLLASGFKMPDDLTTYVKEAAVVPTAVTTPDAMHGVIRQFCPTELDAVLRQTDGLRDVWARMREKYPLLLYCIGQPNQLSHYLELISK